MSEAIGFIVLGTFIAFIGGVAVALAAGENGMVTFIGLMVVGAGAILAQVGTIAAGVILGLRESRAIATLAN